MTDATKLHDIYVDTGVLDALSSDANQVILGRRGVGKTHLLHVYRDHLMSRDPSIVFQIHDCTRLGSGHTPEADNGKTIAANAFNQLLNDIATHAFDDYERITAEDTESRIRDPEDAIFAFLDAITKPGEGGSSFDFRNLGDTLDAFRVAAGASRMIIGLDEFVSLPRISQPYFAEFLKRAFFTKPQITFAIASVLYSTHTYTVCDGNAVGLEPGADTFSDVNLDYYFVWEEEEDQAEEFFSQVLYNHLAQDLGLDTTVGAANKRSWILQNIFTQQRAFSELCRAAEGNCRDFLNIFRTAFFRFYRDRDAQQIGVPHVTGGAEEWFRSEKLRSISNEGHLEQFLNHLIQHVIRGRRTKTFMVHYRDISNPLLTRLFGARLLHPLRTVWKHPDLPGEPYHLVTMDYGCYVALRNTNTGPDETLFYQPDETKYDDLVPLDDRRSIRRVVVTPEDLAMFTPNSPP